MFKLKYIFVFGLLLTLFLDPISGRKSGGHSYPRGGGLSGGGHRSGGLSGGGHGYPSSGSRGYPSGGLSGGSHSYPSSGGSHSYPSSGGTHSYPSSGNTGGSGYPSSGGSHTYPSSGNKQHGYPSSSGGLSGSGHGYPANRPTSHTTNVYNNYHYSPPAQISYTPRGGVPVSYPVYRGTPPTYVYQYKDSGSKYGTLLAGLALMNLGTLGVAAYAAHQSSQNHGSSSYNSYRPQPGEVCKFAIKKENGDYEETRIDCQIISSFILQDMQANSPSSAKNSTITTVTTVTNTTIVNNTNMVPSETTTAPPVPGNVLYQMLPNGTLVPVNTTGVNIPGITPNVTQNATMPVSNGLTSSSVVTTTTTNTTVVNALDVKGKPVEVTPGMQCFVIRNTPSSTMRKAVPCGVLQSYAEKSIRRNSAARNVPLFTVIAAVLAYCVAY